MSIRRSGATFAVAVPVLLACAGRPAAPADAGHLHLPMTHDASAYAGDLVVRVRAQTPAQLSWALDSAEHVLSCRPSLGRTELAISPERLAFLAQSGVEIEVLHTDLEALVEAERTRVLADRQLRGVDWYASYKTLEEFESKMDALVAAYPALASVETIGTSIEGRPIRMLRLAGAGAGPDAPQILLNGCQHAREWVSPATTIFIAEELLADYGSDPEATAALDAIEWLIVPIVNPDGYRFSWTNQRLWRKNRRNHGNGTFGVDLNRNWAYEWGGLGASASTSSDTYRGAAPFSEPETQALRDLALAEPNIRGHIDIHSFSQLILWPFGYDYVDAPEPDKTIFETVGIAMSDAIFATSGVFYDPIRSSDLYPASGDASDWFYGDRGIFSYTFELRDTGTFGFELPAQFIRPTAEENYQAVLVLADLVSTPVQVTQLSPDTTSAGSNASVPVSVSVLPVFESATGVTLWQRQGGSGAFAASALTASGSTWTGALATGDCGGQVQYYLEIDTDAGTTLFEPPAGPAGPRTIGVLDEEIGLEDFCESVGGWIAGAAGDTATTGQWELADPVGTAAQPGDDHTPSGTRCWVTGAPATSVGSHDVDNGITTLTSPALDAASPVSLGDSDPWVSYYRWFSNDQGAAPGEDVLQVLISGDDGATWTPLETVSTSAAAWIRAEFRVADFVTPSAQVRLRFIAGDLGAGSIVEAAIDDVRVIYRGCPEVNACVADVTTTGTSNGTPDGAVDISDFSYYLTLWAAGDAGADVTTTGTSNGTPDGAVDVSDYSYYLTLWAAGCP